MTDILGLKLDDGLKILKDEYPEKRIDLVETFSNKDNDLDFSEARILRIRYLDQSIELIVGYF